MIEPKELRLGNYYKAANFTNHKKVVEAQVKTIAEELIYSDEGYEGLIGRKPEDIEPIPLTEEWLIKLGYKKSDNDLFIHKESGIREVLIEGSSYYLDTDKDYRTIDHVHTLQNLIYYLDGKELQITH